MSRAVGEVWARLAGRDDAIVVGAGFGGLAAAIDLAAAGMSVHVVEAAPTLGGKAGVVTLDDGVRVDTGPSVLTMPDVLDATLRAGGSSLAAELELRTPEPAFRYVYPGGQALEVHTALQDTLASVARTLGDGARADLARYLDRARRIWEAAEPHFVRGPAPTMSSLLSADAIAALPRIDAHRSLWRAIRGDVRDPRLQWLLARYATYNGSDPRRCPATLGCIAWVELGLGAYGVRGGMAAVVKALVRVARRLGVRFTTGARVARVDVDRGRVAGVTLADGASLRAPIVVCNADVAHLAGDLLAAPPKRIATPPPPSMSGWVGIARVPRALADRLAAHTVVFPDRYLDEFADIFDRDRPPADPTVYLCHPGHAFARPGWDDAVPIFAMANAPAEPADRPRDPAAWDALFAAVRRRVEVPELLGERVTWAWVRTPTDLAARFPGTRGAIYGGASNSPLASFRRPPNRVDALPGLYLASGSAHPGGGVPLCVLSGQAAAAAALHDVGARQEVA